MVARTPLSASMRATSKALSPPPITATCAPGSAPGFIAAQIVGALLGLALIAALYPDAARTADDAVIPHHWPTRSNTEQRSPS